MKVVMKGEKLCLHERLPIYSTSKNNEADTISSETNTGYMKNITNLVTC